jgi:hypothetical protein
VDAVFLCDIDEVRALLQRGANPDARDEEHRTLLMNATQSGHREILRVLLEAGADPNLRDADQWTPLDVAVYRKAFDMVWQLVQFGADVNAQDDMGISVLYGQFWPRMVLPRSSICCSAEALAALCPSHPALPRLCAASASRSTALASLASIRRPLVILGRGKTSAIFAPWATAN